MSDRQPKTYKEDGTRPIERGAIEVANTFEEDGVRPIAESPNFLVQNDLQELEALSDREVVENSNIVKENSTPDPDSESDLMLEIDGERPLDNSDVRVVDSFEADGERPIMADKYRVVDRLEVDGDRPITSQ
jgi:hypothetical protein